MATPLVSVLLFEIYFFNMRHLEIGTVRVRGDPEKRPEYIFNVERNL